jgi:hypothetical protein
MNNINEAYEAVAQYLWGFIGGREWSKAVALFTVFPDYVRGEQWLFNSNDEIDSFGGFEGGSQPMFRGLDAASYLRDEMLRTTGDLIWGIKFTLYPSGKFEIEYDYNKPAEYEDSDEIISIEDAVGRLNNLLG